MKILLTIALAIGTFACGTTKETAKEQTQTKPVETVIETIDDAVKGTIKDMRKTDGCDFVISVVMDGKNVLLEPLGLDEKFKVDGKSVTLIYTPSRRQSKCMGTMPIMIEKIK